MEFAERADQGIAQNNANFKSYVPILGLVPIALRQGLLNFNRSLGGVHDRGELGQFPIAHDLHDPGAARRETRVTDDIGDDDRGKAALRWVVHGAKLYLRVSGNPSAA
jgi:hypothetical protein